MAVLEAANEIGGSSGIRMHMELRVSSLRSRALGACIMLDRRDVAPKHIERGTKAHQLHMSKPVAIE